MGLFNFLKNSKEVLTEPIDIFKVYGLVDYSRGEMYTLLNSKPYTETFQKFGLRGVQLHHQLKIHFNSTDVLYDYFNTDSSKDVNRYGFNQIEKTLNNTKQTKSHDITLNFNGIVEKNKTTHQGLSELFNGSYYSTKEVRTRIITNKTFHGIEIEHSNVDLFYDFLSFVTGNKGEMVLDELMNQVIGWNSVCFVTPLSVVYVNYSNIRRVKEIEISIYLSRSSLPHRFSLNLLPRDHTQENRKKLTRWSDIYSSNFDELLIKDNHHFKDLIESEFNLIGQILEVKKNSFEVHELYTENDDFVNDIQMLIRHLNQIVDDIESVYEIKQYRYIGYFTPSPLVSHSIEYLEHKLFEFTVIKNLTELMLECVRLNDKFLYKEIYLILEPYHIFDKTIEKQTLRELKDLNKGISKLNNNLVTLNNTLSRGFKMLNSQLSSINNKLWYNNLLTTINTYQLYKISKK
jgi:hypothetical protein